MQQQSYLKCPCQICGGNIEFPAETAGQSIPCPHCAQNTTLFQQPLAAKSKRFRPACLAVLICVTLGSALAIGILAAKKSVESAKAKPISEIKTDTKIEPEERTPKNKRRPKAAAKSVKAAPEPATQWNGLKPGEISLEKTANSRLIYAVGAIHNQTDRQRFGVKVELDLFDAQNARLGSATDYVQIIEPKMDWKFKALVTDPKAVRAELVAIKEN